MLINNGVMRAINKFDTSSNEFKKYISFMKRYAGNPEIDMVIKTMEAVAEADDHIVDTIGDMLLDDATAAIKMADIYDQRATLKDELVALLK